MKLEREEKILVECALGRIFAMAERPTREGDVEEYERCRRIVLDVLDEQYERVYTEYTRACWAHYNAKGAQGD